MSHIDGERFRGSIGDLRAFQKPGLQTFRRYIRGDLPAPPISRLAGMRPTDAGLGKATFTMPVTRWLEDGFGLYWGGVYALFADAPLASAIWTTLPAGKGGRNLRAPHVVRAADEQGHGEYDRPGRDRSFR